MTPSAKAQSYEQEDKVDVAVTDTDGNLIGTVSMSKEAQRSLAVGAYVTFKGIKALVYTGYIWVCTHPEETLQTLQFLIDGFQILQDIYGMLKSADHDGTEFVGFVKTNGESCVRVPGTDMFQCLYSI